MAVTLNGVLLTGDHASRPSASALANGALYSCTTHSLVYQTNGSAWSTWATLGGSASGSITASGYTQNTAKLLGRTTASAGAVEEISVGSGLSLAAGSLSATGGASFSSYDTLISAMSGLVHRWKFEEASGNFADSVGSLTLTKSGTATYAVAGGPVSGASGSVTFTTAKGLSSTMGSIPVGAAARTIIAIAKCSTGKQALWSYGTWSSTRQLFTAFMNDGASNAVSGGMWADDIVYGSGNSSTVPGPRSADSLYHMHAMMYDGTNALAYMFYDGAHIVRNLGGALNTVDSGTHFSVGLDINGTNQFTGTLDDIAVFTRVLAPYELSILYAALAGQLP